jgi:hypothetical protein
MLNSNEEERDETHCNIFGLSRAGRWIVGRWRLRLGANERTCADRGSLRYGRDNVQAYSSNLQLLVPPVSQELCKPESSA